MMVVMVEMMMMMYIQYDENHQLGNDEGQNLLVPSRAAKALMAALEKKQKEQSVFRSVLFYIQIHFYDFCRFSIFIS